MSAETIMHTNHLLQVQRETMVQTVTDGSGRVRTFAAIGLQEVTNEPKREHQFLSIQSLLDFAKKDCAADKAAVFYDLVKVVLVCDPRPDA